MIYTKNNYLKPILTILFCFCTHFAFTQALLDSLLKKDSSIQASIADGQVSFFAPLPQLTQIPGAPAPFYTYLWDFGDGHFSFSEQPVHDYGQLGTFDVHMYAVNNYDDGKKPQRKTQKVTINKVPNNIAFTSPAEKDFFKANSVFELKYNCMAKPNDTMVLIAGWKNADAETSKGKLYLMLNEKQFDQTCFDTTAFRFFYNDSVTTGTLMAALSSQAQLTVTESGSPPSNFKQTFLNDNAAAANFINHTFSLYKNIYAIDLGTMQPGATHFSFGELHVTPQMLKDTNVTLTVTGLYVPQKGNPIMHRLNIPVVNSHDPNKMNLKGGPLFYRFIKKHQPLTYKVRFQNNGKGPARKISLDMTLPNTLDPQSIQIKDMYPLCDTCTTAQPKRGCWDIVKKENGAIFTFNGIYIPGTQQKGIENKDSTKGFLEFSIVSKKRLENKPFKARTAIYFDNNEPVITNYATGRFHKGISPIIMTGYEKAFGTGMVSNGWVTGIGFAPLAPRFPFLQFELYYKQGLPTTTATILQIDRPGSIIIDSLNREFTYKTFDSSVKNSIHQIKLVPAQLRYNFNKYISAGIGAIVTAHVGGHSNKTKSYLLTNANGVQFPYSVNDEEKIKSFSNWKARPFFDVQFGLVKWGPHLGVRYYYVGDKSNYASIYAGWRL